MAVAWTKRQKVITGAIAGAALLVGGAVMALNLPVSSSGDTLNFEATFDTASDFYNRFDYALSGGSPAQGDDPAADGAGGVFPIHGDHDLSCGAPTTVRDVRVTGEQQTNENPYPAIDFSQMFWWCAPTGDGASGHVMTALTTTGYNHLWFAPKAEFTGITKVCWDINATTEGGKWTEVQFVDHADAVRYPTGTHLAVGVTARGTGGFDLGYTVPDFRPEATGGDSGVGPNTGLQPRSGTLAGLKIEGGSIFDWFQNQDTWTARGYGWPGNIPEVHNGQIITDKATRYTQCVENLPGDQIQVTNGSPYGGRTIVMPGHIPQDARRVVFHDAEYDGPKRGDYSPDRVTWHWDNIRVFTAAGGPPPTTTTLPPTTTTTTAPLTTTTTAPPTTTTTQPPTTTTSTTTTLPPTTTTVPPTTTTTIKPIPACPAGFTTAQRNWCLAVNAHIAALEAKVH